MYIHQFSFNYSKQFSTRQMSLLHQHTYTRGDLEIPLGEANFLQRSDEKVMRQDVKGSIFVVKELLENFPFPHLIPQLSLFVANGAFVENTESHLNRIVDVYKTIDLDTDPAEKIRKIYRASPPLVALETLTNSTMSFVAQYSGIQGNNATFGNTSIAALYALQEAKNSLLTDDFSVVNSSNCGGDYSYLTNSSVLGHAAEWKESAGVAALLLGKSNEKALAKITAMQQGFRIPTLENRAINRTWKMILLDSKSDGIIHSGAYSKNEQEMDADYCATLNNTVYSLFEKYGNMGPTNVLAGIIKATQLIQQGACTIDVVDRDIFGRETMIRIEKC